MALLDMITQLGGSDAIEKLGAQVGLSPAQTHSAATALLPALAGGMKRQAGNAALGGLLAGLAPGAAPTANAASAGNEILGQIFGSKDVSRTVATNAAATTGIDASKLKALLPLLATLGAGALASKASASTGAAGGGLSGMLGMLDQDGDGDPLNDIMGIAGKFLGR